MKRVSVDSVVMADALLGQMMSDLARAAGLEPRRLSPPQPPREVFDEPLLLDYWMEAVAEYFGIEAESVSTTFADVDKDLTKTAPCIVRIPMRDGSHGNIVVLRREGRDLVVLLPGHLLRRVAADEVARMLRAPLHEGLAPRLAKWTAALPVDEKGARRAQDALLFHIAGRESIGGIWLLRSRPGAPLMTQLRGSGDLARALAFGVLPITQISLSLLGWTSLFDATLKGRLDSGPLLRWALLTLSVALVEILRSVVVARTTVSVAAILKRRMLSGALNMDPNEIRSKGSGGILGLISESEVLETAGLSAVVSAVSALISLCTAALVLAKGAAGLLHVGLLVAWSAVLTAALFAMNARTKKWIESRLVMTNGLVERMVGHRTRMAQEKIAGRHKPEDVELELYLAESRRNDSLARYIQGLPSRGWLLLGFAVLLAPLWEGTADTASLLVSIGGLFVAQSAFGDIAGAVTSALNLSVAWGRSSALFEASALDEPHGLPSAAVQEIGAMRKQAESENELSPDSGTVLEARRVTYRYRTGGEPVLRGVDLRLKKGDRVLLEGPSGCGKSTLATLLAGLRRPDSGLVLHHGMDRVTLGTPSWRKKVASVPQFHENHVLTGSLLFNLVLGRRWPASPRDRALAEEVCRSLGLGELLDKMPAGLEQIVGETGWQLSHGERTRVFLARALLQEAEVIVVDESFGALDPKSLRVAIEATWEQAPTLVVIAHP